MLTDNVARHPGAGAPCARRQGVRLRVFLLDLGVRHDPRARADGSRAVVNVDAYGLTKLLGEKLLQESAGALPSLSIRLPAVIGRGSKRNWPSEALRKLKAGEPLDYFNPDAPFNNVVHERDVAALVGAALQRGLGGSGDGDRRRGRPDDHCPGGSDAGGRHRLALAGHRAERATAPPS